MRPQPKGTTMARKPANLVYAVDERPPLVTCALQGFQHVLVFFISLLFPVLVVRELAADLSPQVARSLVAMSMIAGGVTTVLQALRRGPVGSGYLCPEVCGPSYLSASLQAAAAGGLPLVFGMTAFVGFVEVAFSRLIRRLRPLLTPEVTGVVVLMVGLVVVPLALRNFFGVTYVDGALRADTTSTAIGVATLVLMVASNTFGRGWVKLYSIMIGMAGGYALSVAAGILPLADLSALRDLPWFAVPSVSHLSWTFDWRFVIPFTVAALASSLKTVGDLATCQKINDADWQRPDMDSIADGVLADGLAGVVPGLIGGYGQSTSSSNVGLSIASGITSRYVAYAAGAIFVALAFLPRLSQVFVLVPRPVIGATLVFAVSFMIVTGIQLITSRLLDARKTFVVGLSIILGMSVDLVPGIYDNVHAWVEPLFSSSLALATVLAIGLTLVLRLGIKRRATLELDVRTSNSTDINDFMQQQGALWSARRDVIDRAVAAMTEIFELAPTLGMRSPAMTMIVDFDELQLEIEIRYEGESMAFPAAPPSAADYEHDDSAFAWLAGYMVRRSVDRVTVNTEGDSVIIHLQLDH